MKLIKIIKSRRDKHGTLRKWGLFWCDFCEQKIEKQLNTGKKQKSCGCHKNKIHGGSYSRLYKIRRCILERCLNPKSKDYKNYGGKGIKVCTEWLDKKTGYINFRDWALNNRYTDNLTIDRINNNGNYEPSNCRWVTIKENNRNRNFNKVNKELANKIRFESKITILKREQLAKKYNVGLRTLYHILANDTWGE